MSFLLRTLSVLIGAAFLLAVANLAISGLPGAGAPAAELASAGEDAGATAAPNRPEDAGPTLRDVLAGALGVSHGAAPVAASEDAADAGTALDATAPDAASGSLLTLAGPGPARAAEEAWRTWMEANGLQAGAMVLRLPDGTEHLAAIGRDPGERVPVAGLSMAITGICLDLVLQERDLGWYTSLAEIAAPMSELRVTPQPWNRDLTLADFVTHTSGLAPDLTRGRLDDALVGVLGLHRSIASDALRRENMQGSRGDFFLSNTNYAVLGVVIEALTGQSYAEACMDRVITPAGIADAVIEGRMGARSSYGGWEMSASDYARFAQTWLTAGNAPIDQPASRPMHDHHALGYRIEGAGDRAQVTLAGQYCHADARPDTGAYLHARGDGTVFSANWTGCVRGEAGTLGPAIAIALR